MASKKSWGPLLWSIVILLICSRQVASESFVVLDSIAGKAEVQKSGLNGWKVLIQGAKLSNNDIIRVLDSSTVRLQWPNNNVVYIYKNSQILINLFDSEQTGIASRHLTIFFGAAFFVLKTVLPRELTAPFDFKVYTPVSVVAIRGTSFEMQVDPKDGATDIRILNGTVLVRNILKNISSFLGAGYKTRIAMNVDPMPPTAVLETDIQMLKRWVPPAVVDEEMKDQILASRSAQRAIKGNFERKIILGSFSNASSYSGPWKIEFLFPSFLALQLATLQKNYLVEVVDSLGPGNIFPLGQSRKARYCILGSIKEFDIVNVAKISPSADNYYENSIARVRISYQVIDIEERKQIFEDEIRAEVSAKNLPENNWKAIGKLPFDPANPNFAKSIVGSAVVQALEEISEKVLNYIR